MTIEVGSIWRHYKGRLYEIVCEGTIEATGCPCVVYRSKDTGQVWVRTLSDFEAEVKMPVPRFVREDPSDSVI